MPFPQAGFFSIYVHGHSTGGPYVSMLSQRIPNIAGVIAPAVARFYHDAIKGGGYVVD